jgi:hypothetical protein
MLAKRGQVRGHSAPHNKQLQRTVIPNRWRGASAPFHHALAPRFNPRFNPQRGPLNCGVMRTQR